MNKRNAHVLLVEDDSVNQLVASLILRQHGIDLTIANNGAEAVAQICSKVFQLVLMDIQMPIMDGCEAATRIRAMSDPYFKTVPILAFTASTIADTQVMIAQNGMTDLLSKPLDVDDLLRKLDKYMPTVRRPLLIDFNLYTDGDPIFKRELISHLIDNVKELQSALMALTQTASADLTQVLHKVKASVAMLNDREFSETLEEIRWMLNLSQPFEFLQRKVKSFSRLCDQMIASLVAESNGGSGVTSQLAHS